jgi:DNA-binding LacI/PurR family transcriptional regulator
VLNGRPGVARATREKVIDALASLGYDDVPQPARNRPSVIGIACGDFTNPVFPTLVHHIGGALASRGFLTTMALVDDRRNPEERCITEFIRTGVDGVIFIGGRHAQVDVPRDQYAELLRRDMAVVLVNGDVTQLDVPHVRCDEGIAAGMAVGHLLQLGHTKIGCIVGDERYVPTRRLVDRFRHSMADAGLAVSDDVVLHTAFTLEAARAAATRLLATGITGVITANDLMALGVISAARAAGLSVPGDISVVGYDGTDLTMFTNPPLTTLRQPFEDMASMIANAVVGELEGDRTFRDHFVFEPELLARGSSGAAPAGG